MNELRLVGKTIIKAFEENGIPRENIIQVYQEMKKELSNLDIIQFTPAWMPRENTLSFPKKKGEVRILDWESKQQSRMIKNNSDEKMVMIHDGVVFFLIQY